MPASSDTVATAEVPIYAEAFGRQIHLGTWLFDISLVRDLAADPGKFTVRLDLNESPCPDA